MTWLLVGVYVILSALGMVLIKLGGKTNSLNIQASNVSLKIDYVFALGVVLFAISFVLWTIILQKFKITFISPVAYGLTFVVLVIFSFLILKEKVNSYNIMGAVIIIIGVTVSYMGIKPD